MSRAVSLGGEIVGVVGVSGQLVRDTFYDLNPRRSETRNLFRIVGEQLDAVLPQQMKHARGHPEIARVDRKAQPQIGIHRVKPLILQLVGAQFVDEADATPFLPQIEQNSPAFFSNQREGGVEL
ncbi:MAG: hypothetical protein RLZZ366_1912, partial [Pseudomonadota bacterium]